MCFVHVHGLLAVPGYLICVLKIKVVHVSDEDAYVYVVVFCEEVFCFVGGGESCFGNGKTFGVVYEDRILFFLGFAHLVLLLMKLLGGSLER